MATLREKIGQMFMVGLGGEELTQEEKHLLIDYPFGGFILFKHNLREPKQILSLCRVLWESKKALSPFIAIDQEGGRVHRLPASFTHFPPAAAVGRTGKSDLALRVGEATARELSAVGINLNFAPVLDVNSNPKNPVIGDRSLSSDPSEVTRLGGSIIQGLRGGGVIPCAKHFPGHGDTFQDSHIELPVVKKERALLESVELPPFVHACRNGVETLMTAHVLYPALDASAPATLSRRILADLLRGELAYDGVVFGDDLEMQAISNNYPLEEAVTLTVNAGVDVLMFCHETANSVAAFDFLRKQAEKSEQMKTRVEESYQRIKKLKQRYLRSFAGVGENLLTEHIGITTHQKLAEEISKTREY